MTDNTRDRDNSPALGLHHGARAGPHEAETRFEVDADHLVPFLVLHSHGEIITRDAGIINEDVHAAESVDGRRDKLFDLLCVRQIARDFDMIAAGFRIELFAKGTQLVAIRARKCNPRALFCERIGDG